MLVVFIVYMTKKETTILDVEGLMSELYNKLKDEKLNKQEKKECVKRLKHLEQHYRNVQDKHINGKKYPPKDLGYSSDKPMNKAELYKLIDSVETDPLDEDLRNVLNNRSISGVSIVEPLDLSGVSVGKDRFVEIDQDIDIRTSILDTRKSS